ncbi:MAG: GNAT family N-acetyltransferase [Oscillospiraceae bacterium]|nr:GNAT family N-acetyltransferase [Oscillospiraceae bacterium]
MIIRDLQPNDAMQHCKVSSSAFIWNVDPEKDVKLPDESAIGAFMDDGTTMMAEIEHENFNVFYGSGTLGCVGIGGVASKPEYRRHGAVRQLFLEVERRAASNGWDVGILYPFSTSYYRLFGYENLARFCDAKINFKYLSFIERNCDVDLFEGDNLAPLLELYNKTARQYNLAFRRESDRYFGKKPYETCNYTYMWRNKDGEYRAYATYQVSRAESAVQVGEIGFLDRESLLGILGFLRCYDGNQEYISFGKLPLNSPLFDVIPDSNKFERRMFNLGSGRIYNVEKVLAQNIYPKEYGRFSLSIEDSMPENAGIYDVEYQNGAAQIAKRDAGDYDIALDAACAAKLLLSGGCTLQAMRYWPGARILRENEDAIRAFPDRNTFFMDGF